MMHPPQGLSMLPRPGDTFVVTTPKAGTTWVMMICHQLRTKGDLDFREITAVVPWVELAHDIVSWTCDDGGGIKVWVI